MTCGFHENTSKSDRRAMGKVDRFEITYSKPDAQYVPGEVVSGVLTLVANETISARGVRIHFKGKARVRWSEGSGNNRRHYSATEQYFSHEILVFGILPSQGSEKKDLTMGTHTFPFEFQLPPTLPASFQHCVGRVTYSVKGVIDLPWAIDVKTKSPFTVGSILDLNLWPDVKGEARASNQKNICCLCCTSGPVSGMVHVPRKGYVPGETVQFFAEIENHSRRQMKQTFVALVQVLSFHATTKTRRVNNELPGTRLTHPAIRPGGSDQWNGERLVIPPGLPPSFLNGCRIIDINYVVRLSVDPAGPALDLQVPAEIVLGTVPLSLEGGNTTTTDYTQWAVPTFPSSTGNTTVPASALYGESAFGNSGTVGGGEDSKYSTTNSYSQW